MPQFESLIPTILFLAIFYCVSGCASNQRNWARTLIVGISTLLVLRYFWWRISETVFPVDLGSIEDLWVVLCICVEILLFSDILLSYLSFTKTVNRSPEADAHEARLRALPPGKLPSFDVYIPSYNEPMDVLERTIVGALSIDYPRFKVWILDDGRRDWLREYCEKKGVGYLDRPNNDHAKAGNVNAALSRTDGDLIALLDADFIPHRNFLYRTAGFFDDPTIGVVQTPQLFFNLDPTQINLGLNDKWPEEQRLFFDVVQPSKDAWDCSFCCGSGAVLRRSAMLEIGGMPTASITEDMLTTMAQLRVGYVTRFLNEPLCLGLAAESIDAYFVQRKRWCRGGIQLLFIKEGPLGPNLTILQRLMFMPTYWALQLPAKVFIMLVPVVYMWTGLEPLHVGDVENVFAYQFPVIIASFITLRWLAPGSYMPILSTATSIFTAIRLTPTVLASFIKPFGEPFRVTPKGADNKGTHYDVTVFYFCLLLLVGNVGGVLLNTLPDFADQAQQGFFPIAAMWAFINAVTLFFALLLSTEKPRHRTEERFPLGEEGECTALDTKMPCRIANLSRNGASLSFDDDDLPQEGAMLVLQIEGVGAVIADVMHRRNNNLGVKFRGLDPEVREELIFLLNELAFRQSGRRRSTRRVSLNQPADIRFGDNVVTCNLADSSLSGVRLDFDEADPPEVGSDILINFAGVGHLEAEVVRKGPGNIGAVFKNMPGIRRDALIRRLYTEGLYNNASGETDVEEVALGLLARTFGRAAT